MRSWDQASSTARARVKPAPCKTRTYSSSAQATPLGRRRCTWPSIFARSPWSFGARASRSRCRATSHARLDSTVNVAVRYRTEVVDGDGPGQLESLTLADHANDRLEQVSAAALFIMIGGEPHTAWLPDEIERDDQGYLITGRELLERTAVRWDRVGNPYRLKRACLAYSRPATYAGALSSASPPGSAKARQSFASSTSTSANTTRSA